MIAKLTDPAPRELKFRVYIPDQEMFSYFELGKFELADRYLFQDKHRVQQFTGMKDKDGTHIYEGDLLSFRYLDDGMRYVGEIAYSEKFGGFMVVVDRAFEMLSDLLDYARFFKVIGNKTENPELLDGRGQHTSAE